MDEQLLQSKESLSRPAWTSEQKTGLFNSYKHKHSLYKGCFSLAIDYYTKTKGLKH